jgi:RHS repeat-associated protein
VETNIGGAYDEVAYDAAGEEAGENNRTTWTLSVVPFKGRHLVHYQNASAYFNHANGVGSTNTVTDNTGTVVQDQLYYPWGQDWAMAGSLQEKRFASLQHRDTNTNLDPTRFRMMSSTQGRWFSPDPLHGNVANPQSLTRYAYVLNNPASLVDPLGLDEGCSPDATCVQVTAPAPAPVSCVFNACGSNYNPYYYGPSFQFGGGRIGGGGGPTARTPQKPQSIPSNDVPVSPQAQTILGKPTLPTRLGNWAVGYFCGSSPEGAVENWFEVGAVKGALTGAITGGLTGAVFGEGVGAAGGVFGGLAAAGVCSIAGVYGD